MRNYIIQPYLHNGEQQGYLVTSNRSRWRASHSAIELCETAILKREKLWGDAHRKSHIYGKDFQIIYNNCESEEISDVRLALYR